MGGWRYHHKFQDHLGTVPQSMPCLVFTLSRVMFIALVWLCLSSWQDANLWTGECPCSVDLCLYLFRLAQEGFQWHHLSLLQMVMRYLSRWRLVFGGCLWWLSQKGLCLLIQLPAKSRAVIGQVGHSAAAWHRCTGQNGWPCIEGDLPSQVTLPLCWYYCFVCPGTLSARCFTWDGLIL